MMEKILEYRMIDENSISDRDSGSFPASDVLKYDGRSGEYNFQIGNVNNTRISVLQTNFE